MSSEQNIRIDENGVARDKNGRETLHPSHVTRMSDSSLFDEICTVCGATDRVPGGWGNLAKPCSKAS